MYAVADTDRLVADGVIEQEQASAIEARARETMIVLAVNSLLCLGITAATGGLIFWLASAMAVAICGMLFLAVGASILTSRSERFHIFGNAATLIGAGMLIGGAAIELTDKYETIAGAAMTVAGGAIILISGWIMSLPNPAARFVAGSIMLMGLAMHERALTPTTERSGCWRPYEQIIASQFL